MLFLLTNLTSLTWPDSLDLLWFCTGMRYTQTKHKYVDSFSALTLKCSQTAYSNQAHNYCIAMNSPGRWKIQGHSALLLFSTAAPVILLPTHSSVMRFLIPSLHNLGFPSSHSGIIFTLKKFKTKKMRALKSVTQRKYSAVNFPCHICIKSWWLFLEVALSVPNSSAAHGIFCIG